jgi:DNA-binding CsgD family transcriptional regulator
VTLGTLLFNVVSLSTSLGALVALGALAFHLRSRGVLLLLGAILFLTTDYVLGVVHFALPDSPLWNGLAGLAAAESWVIVVFGLKGICHVGILLTGPLAVLLLFGRRPSRAAAWAVAGASAAELAALGLLMAGRFSPEPLAVYAVTAAPAYAAYVMSLLLLVRLRPTVKGPGLVRGIVTAAIVEMALFIPALFATDIAALAGVAPRSLPVDPIAFLVLTVGILVCALLVLLGAGRRLAAGDLDAFCARHELSVREREVLVLLGRGLRYKQIADELAISLDTVKTHVSRIYRKTSSTGKTDLFYRIRLGSP